MRFVRFWILGIVERKIRNDTGKNVFVLKDLLSETTKRYGTEGLARGLRCERVLDRALTGILIDEGNLLEPLREVPGLERELQHTNGERESIAALLLPWLDT